MKAFLLIKSSILLLSVVAISCNNQQKNMDQDQVKYYATSQEAVKKAKEDLLAVIRSNKDFAPGVEAATLEKTEGGNEVRHVELSFDKLLIADSTGDLDKLIGSEMNTVIPLISNNNVATIVELNKSDKGWKIASLAGKEIADDLNTIRSAVGDSGQSITIYNVPNLQTKVYGVKKGGAELFYTNYGGQFSMRQGVKISDLLPALKNAAQRFQKEFGDKIKQQKLVR
jgi:hypothetical protein